MAIKLRNFVKTIAADERTGRVEINHAFFSGADRWNRLEMWAYLVDSGVHDDVV